MKLRAWNALSVATGGGAFSMTNWADVHALRMFARADMSVAAAWSGWCSSASSVARSRAAWTRISRSLTSDG